MTGAQRCHAHSSRTGEPCKRYAVRGATVCMSHGGSRTATRQKAQERLLAMVDPALSELARLINRARNDQVRLGAIIQVLDRNGLKLADRVETTADVTIRVEYEQLPMTDQAAKGPEPGPLPLHTNGKAH